MVRGSLVDDEADVRSAAARAFDALQRYKSYRSDDTHLTGGSPSAWQRVRYGSPGIEGGHERECCLSCDSSCGYDPSQVRASTVFPVLIPTLLSEPITVFNARALGSLVTVAGNILSKRLNAIMNSLVKVLEDGTDEELKSAVEDALHTLIASVNDAEGLNTQMMILLGW